MSPKWLIGLGIIFVFSTIICVVLDQSTGKVSGLSEAVAGLQMLDFSNPITGIFSMFRGLGSMIYIFITVMMWDYYFFDGYWEWARYFLICISFGIVISFMLSLVRGASS